MKFSGVFDWFLSPIRTADRGVQLRHSLAGVLQNGKRLEQKVMSNDSSSTHSHYREVMVSCTASVAIESFYGCVSEKGAYNNSL